MEKTTVHDNLHTEVMENVIYIQMLGGFSMTYHGQPVLLGKSLSSKMLHLLMFLIYSRGEGIRRIRLLEQLYGDSDTEQAANSLRAMIFRLRKSLIAAGLPDGEYISTKGGVYMWTADHVDVELDVEVFQKQVMAALEEKDPVKAVELLEEACGLYKGEFLPLMTGYLPRTGSIRSFTSRSYGNSPDS